jgi:hypothetical protein
MKIQNIVIQICFVFKNWAGMRSNPVLSHCEFLSSPKGIPKPNSFSLLFPGLNALGAAFSLYVNHPL